MAVLWVVPLACGKTAALGGALLASGIGALGPGEALILAGSALAITGTTTVAASVAAPNIAYAVQNGDGGGDGGGSDSSSSEDPSRDGDARALVEEHTDGKNNPQLTLDNAYRALDGAPEGTRARVMPKENELTSKPGAKGKDRVKNADLEYLDQQGDIVGYGEVKTIGEADEGRFTGQLDSAVKQLRWRQDWKGGTDVDEIFIQVPDLADPPEVKQWVRSYQDARRGGVKSISGFRLRVFSESGNSLGTFDLGANADEGYVEDHTYHSSNGYSY
ncbi:hypothetical protein [Streptomyces sp. NPDC005784]|uniref:hypothetical protein n=1 Tax=Streptomyces sp. NPDC005784 TaxID=3364731 RepID=UPI0036C16391